jgi:hypothetical protein
VNTSQLPHTIDRKIRPRDHQPVNSAKKIIIYIENIYLHIRPGITNLTTPRRVSAHFFFEKIPIIDFFSENKISKHSAAVASLKSCVHNYYEIIIY